jgi:predicted dienelactone hydrolase
MEYTMKHKLFFTVLVLVALLTGAIMTSAQDDPPFGALFGAPDMGVRGSHPVGVMEMVMDNAERPLEFTIWYPALNDEGVADDYTYTLDYPPVVSDLEAIGHAIADATPDTANGPYPLVIHAHGFGGVREGYLHYTEHLASHGYVVIAASHTGATLNTAMSSPDSTWPMLYQYPRDFGLLIDYAETLNSDGVLAGMVDTESVAVSGHSAGGFSALMAAGAQLDLNYLAEQCEQGLELNDCELFVPYLQEIADSLGLDVMPEGLWPSARDERIDVVMPMAPDQITFGPEGLGSVTIPTLYFVGTGDFSIPPEEYNPGFASLGSESAYMVELEYATHGLFSNDCYNNIPMLMEWGWFGFCFEPVWDRSRAHDVINHYATAFLDWQLKGVSDNEAYFNSDVEYMLPVMGVNIYEN